MKKYAFVILIIFGVPLISYSQKLTLENLITLYKSNDDDASDFMQTQGWKRMSKYEGASEFGITFSYGSRNPTLDHGRLNKVNSILMKYVEYEASFKNINDIKKRAIAIGMKKKGSEINQYKSIVSYLGALIIV